MDDIQKEAVHPLEAMGISGGGVQAFNLTAIQEKCIPLMMDGHDIIAIAPTGTGKTLGFGIPMLEYVNLDDSSVQEVVLAPTRELAQQIADELTNLAHFIKGVKIAVIYGGQPFGKQMSALNRKPQVLVATPGRLLDHMQRGNIRLGTVHTMVLDEADEMLKMGFVQALGVLIDTVVICSCTAFMMLLAPANVTTGLTGMDLLQAAAQYHLGSFGVVFIAVTLALFSFSTFIGILFYARSNVAYLFGDRWGWQTAYKVLALVMLMVGGLEAYTVVWNLGDVGIGLMTIFNLIALYPMSGEAIAALRDYERRKHLTQN